MNYRSAVVYGAPRTVTDNAEKLTALDTAGLQRPARRDPYKPSAALAERIIARGRHLPRPRLPGPRPPLRR